MQKLKEGLGKLWHRVHHASHSQNHFAFIALFVVMGAFYMAWRVDAASQRVAETPQPEQQAVTEVPTQVLPKATPKPKPKPKPVAQKIAPPVAPTNWHQHGFSAGDLVSLSPDTLQKQLKDFRRLGMKWVRLDIPWSVVQEGGPNSYNWGSYDRVIDAARAHGLQVLGIIDYTPKWARPANCQGSQYCAPANVDQFASYAKSVVSRYKSKGVRYWEIWNEPNKASFWQPRANAGAYAALLKKTAASIRSADPNAQIITGGLAPAFTEDGNIAPAAFLTTLYKNGVRTSFTAVAHHSYSYPALPSWGESWNGWVQMKQMRSIMVAYGDSSKKLWITEYGAPTNGPGVQATASNFKFTQHPDHVDEHLQSLIVKQAITLHRSYAWTGPMFWYHYQDKGTSTADNENFFGMLRYNGSKKPAYAVLESMLRR